MITNYFHKTKYLSILLIFSILLSSCASFEQMGQKEQSGTVIGTTAGTILGGILGDRLGGKAGVFIGAGIGALIGGLIGNRIGHSFDERDKEILKIAKEEDVELKTETISDLNKDEENKLEQSINLLPEKIKAKKIKSHSIYTTTIQTQFEERNANLSQKEYKIFNRLAKAYRKDGVRKIIITVHTDNNGNSFENQNITEIKAKNIAKIFIKNGYPAKTVFFHGAGNSQPIVNNSSSRGKTKNKRVEITDAENVSGFTLVIRKTINKTRDIIAEEHNKTDEINKQAILQKNANSCKLQFNGVPYNGQRLLSNGTLSYQKQKGWSIGTFFGSEAKASSIDNIPAFLDDKVIEQGKIKRMDGKSVNIYDNENEYLPGYKNQPVYTYVGGGFLSLYPVSLLKENILPSYQNPCMVIYSKYSPDTKKGKKDYEVKGTSWVYVNGNIILYRWKPLPMNNKTGVIGVDILLRKYDDSDFIKNTTEQFTAQVYYLNNSQIYTAAIPLSMKKMKKNNIKWRL